MLLCNCKAKIKKLSTAFAIALLSARLEQTVCYLMPAYFLRKVPIETNITNYEFICLTETECHRKQFVKIARAGENLQSFFAKFGLCGRFVRFANGLGKLCEDKNLPVPITVSFGIELVIESILLLFVTVCFPCCYLNFAKVVIDTYNYTTSICSSTKIPILIFKINRCTTYI